MKNLFFLSTAISLLSLWACSNENEYNEEIITEEIVNKVITSIEEMPEEIQKIIAETKPYISPAMQEWIDLCDTITTVQPIEEIFPFLLSAEHPEPTTRAALPTTTVTGYYSYSTILNPIEVTLTSYTTSALRQSLRFNSDELQLIGSGPTYRMKFYAVTQYFYFTTSVSAVAAMPTTENYIGMNPDKMPAPSAITNNTSFDFGFTIEAIVEGYLYQGTTYVIGMAQTTGEEPSYLLFPWFYRSVFDYSFFTYGNMLEWTYFAF